MCARDKASFRSEGYHVAGIAEAGERVFVMRFETRKRRNWTRKSSGGVSNERVQGGAIMGC